MTTMKTLGGDRLGAGKKQKVALHGFERSTHDLSYIWRNTQAPGTLVPFMSRVALPGDNWEIDLNAQVLTHPTVGPLFASFKLQLDVFQCPIRLYNSWLHNNKLKIGNNMSQVKLPQLLIVCNPLDKYEQGRTGDETWPLEQQQINQSSLLSYLGLRGIGQGKLRATRAYKNAIPYLAYWDIYKNYYANKQEEIGMMIHTARSAALDPLYPEFDEMVITSGGSPIYSGDGKQLFNDVGLSKVSCSTTKTIMVRLISEWQVAPPNGTTLKVNFCKSDVDETDIRYAVRTVEIGCQQADWSLINGKYEVTKNLVMTGYDMAYATILGATFDKNPTLEKQQTQINVIKFPLENIDTMREDILMAGGGEPFEIDANYGLTPYELPLQQVEAADSTGQICSYFSQEGLALKTYQSDLFNNWLNTEWIDGTGGINEITAVSTAGGSFDINTLNLAQKVYDMLNRIAVSGGSYEDWMEAVWDHDGYRKAETPMYMGGLSKEIIFQEVVSTAESQKTEEEVTTTKALGSLAGKGVLAGKHKGGKVSINVSEPSYIIGIVSITPRIDYSQGNNWDMTLETMDDFHKPSLDEIGFQELITDQMAFWDTKINEFWEPVYKSAGKQPAWLNYMTDYNRLHGNFADSRNEMFMTLARRYTMDTYFESIQDLTTYIDPIKFNYAFAQTDRTAQNFWVQIACDVTTRRKMSAKIMPNL